MAIANYLGQNAKAFKGNLKPYNFYKGETKLAGWKWVTKSDPQTIVCDKAYDYRYDGLTVTGKTTQIGTPAPNWIINNKAVNGIFSNGTTGWSLNGASVYSIANNELTFTNLGSTGTYKAWQKFATVIGRVYAFRIKMKSSSSLDRLVVMPQGHVAAHTGSGNYELLTVVTTATAIETEVRFLNSSRSGDISASPVVITEAIAIDLAADGIPNATATELNTKVPFYFSGTHTVVNAIEPYSPNLTLTARNSYPSLVEYTASTWAEWTKYSSRITSDLNGITLVGGNTSDALNYAQISTNAKPSTKYLILFDVVSTTITDEWKVYFGSGGANEAFVKNLFVDTIGMKKVILTTPTVITGNYLKVRMISNANATQTIKIKDFRILELPTGSQIETDANTKTADELNMKYPFCSKERIQKVTIPLGVGMGLPNGVADSIEWRLHADGWHKWSIQNILLYTINGSEALSLESYTDYTEFYFQKSGKYENESTSTANMWCDTFPCKAISDPTSRSLSNNVHTFAGNRIAITVSNTMIGIVNEDTISIKIQKFKTWLATHPIKVWYRLATPIETDIGAVDVPTWYPYSVLQLSEQSGGMTASYKSFGG